MGINTYKNPKKIIDSGRCKIKNLELIKSCPLMRLILYVLGWIIIPEKIDTDKVD